MKLYEYLSSKGIASLSESKILIRDSRIKVNAEIITNFNYKVSDEDVVFFDNNYIEEISNKEYFLLNKPQGYIASISQRLQKNNILDLFQGEKNRVYPLDYLDFDAEGLVIFLNDSELDNELNSKKDIENEYELKVSGLLRKEDSRKIGDSTFRILNVKYDDLKENTYLNLIVKGYSLKEIKEKFNQVSHPVKKAKRIRYGNLVLDVPRGKYRRIKPHEVKLLRLLSTLNSKK